MNNNNLRLFNYLNIKDLNAQADLIIGFGHFDLRIPEHCISLYKNGFAPKIIFTGGVGAGSGNFKHPESVEFLNYSKTQHPEINFNDVIVESKSTNTGENILNSIEMMNDMGLLKSVKRIILVATPIRQLRVFLTVKKYLPNVELINIPPDSTYEEDNYMYLENNQFLAEQLNEEIERVINYPNKEFIYKEHIPDYILSIYKNIKRETFLNKNLIAG